MKLSCNVIRDLLPLYAENLTSEESNALVDEHLCGCDECAKQLGILKKAQAIPVETDAPGLKKIRKAIVRRRVLAVTMAVMLVITLVLGATFLWEAPVWLDADQAVKEVVKMEDGSIRIYYTDIIQGISSEDDMAGNRGTLCWSSWGRVHFGEQMLTLMLRRMTRGEPQPTAATVTPLCRKNCRNWMPRGTIIGISAPRMAGRRCFC